MKLGPGSLVLGCAAPGFATNGVPCEVPLAGTNVLTVAGGSLRVAAANAVNGLAVSFAAGTTLVVDPYPADADLRAYGAINTKWGAPFANAQGGAIPVSFLDRQIPDTALSVAICTVSSTAATPTFTFPQRYSRLKAVSSAWRTNGDGTRTFEVRFEKQGVVVVYR